MTEFRAQLFKVHPARPTAGKDVHRRIPVTHLLLVPLAIIQPAYPYVLKEDVIVVGSLRRIIAVDQVPDKVKGFGGVRAAVVEGVMPYHEIGPGPYHPAGGIEL